MSTYAEFLERKAATVAPLGVTVTDIHPMLHDWQAEIVRWATRIGRAAIWADTGLGKTVMQVEWARHLIGDGQALIVAPLAVCQQTVREAAKLGVEAVYIREHPAGPGIYVTNYEMVEHFDPARITAVVLDEASILKNSDGKTRARLIAHFRDVDYRLACTATPAPNDNEELTNQAEFLGVMSRANMLAAYYVHDSDAGWRLKGHARRPMFRWMASWALALRRPSDMGYPDEGYILPGLDIIPHLLAVDVVPDGQLFATDLGGVGGRAAVRRATLVPRCEKVIELVNESHELAALRGKLAAWDGSPSTPPLAVRSTSPTPPSESDERLRAGTPKRTANTCASTTGRTLNGSADRPRSSPSTTQDDVLDTPLTRSSEQSASDSPSSETRSPSATTAFGSRTGSAPASTMTDSETKTADVPSANRLSATGRGVDSPSITATTLVESGVSCAENATSDSASSETIPSSSQPQWNTSPARLEPWIIWCGLNDEQTYLEKAFGDRCISLTGSQSPEEKVDLLYRWLDGDRPILLTKTSIAGMGINMQHCARMAFVGLSDSYEAYYQAIRRCYRYGQTRPVHAHVVLSDLEGQIAVNVARKERDAAAVMDHLVREMRAAKDANYLGATT